MFTPFITLDGVSQQLLLTYDSFLFIFYLNHYPSRCPSCLFLPLFTIISDDRYNYFIMVSY